MFLNLTVFKDNKAVVTSRDPDLIKKLKPLRSTISEKIEIQLRDNKSKKPLLPTPNRPSPFKPTFSCVARSVDMNISPTDILTALRDQNIEAKNAWRIKSRQTGQDTFPFRIISNCPKSIDRLLSNGFKMFSKNYRCEPSQSPGPQPLQCGKCFAFGHNTSSCHQKPLCYRCGLKHDPSTCTSSPSCTNCKGKHLAFDSKCPKRPDPKTLTPSKTAPVKCVDPPAEELSDKNDDSSPELSSTPESERFTRIEDVIRFTYLCMSSLHPNSRLVEDVVARHAAQFFRRKVSYVMRGSHVHISITHLQTPKTYSHS
ncbi:uncharacterized protein LOC112906295 [Agrilus planipennis]|uniref:Uncharacterized protein LOC112906295 n=1 Tax=Agrilus planipennis TaxID=224129 RepID=A0A7F5RJD6_AGRPL|nr:uncharacterized protein LOC112906295 [Agrilus planipennis]